MPVVEAVRPMCTAYAAGLRDGDLLVRLGDECADVNDVNYLHVSNALRSLSLPAGAAGERVEVEALGPRVCGVDEGGRGEERNDEKASNNDDDDDDDVAHGNGNGNGRTVHSEQSPELESLLCSSGIANEQHVVASSSGSARAGGGGGDAGGSVIITGTVLYDTVRFSAVFGQLGPQLPPVATESVAHVDRLLYSRWKRRDALYHVVASVGLAAAGPGPSSSYFLSPRRRRRTNPLEVFERHNYMLLERASTTCLAACLPLLVQSIPTLGGIRFASFWDLGGAGAGDGVDGDDNHDAGTGEAPRSPLPGGEFRLDDQRRGAHNVVRFLISRCLEDDTMLCALFWHLHSSGEGSAGVGDGERPCTVFSEALRELVLVLTLGDEAEAAAESGAGEAAEQARQNHGRDHDHGEDNDHGHPGERRLLRRVLLGQLSSSDEGVPDENAPAYTSVDMSGHGEGLNVLGTPGSSANTTPVKLVSTASPGLLDRSPVPDEGLGTWRDVDDLHSFLEATAAAAGIDADPDADTDEKKEGEDDETLSQPSQDMSSYGESAEIGVGRLHINTSLCASGQAKDAGARLRKAWMLARQTALFEAVRRAGLLARSARLDVNVERSDVLKTALRAEVRTAQRTLLNRFFDRSTSVSGDEGALWPVVNPVDPTVLLLGLDVDQCRVMRTSKRPVLLSFRALARNAAPGTAPHFTRLLFKVEDEVRQDEFVLLLFSLLDRVVLTPGARSDNDSAASAAAVASSRSSSPPISPAPPASEVGTLVDDNFWCMTHYRVLALGPRSGLVEWADDATPLTDIISSQGENPLRAYLQQHAPSDTDAYGVRANVMETFVRSCAAYSVLTFVLGVGDRHLDNLLLRTSGAFMHVDFGYCFGRDPKPKPFVSPVRFTREMLAVLGGTGSPHFERCMAFAATAYRALREDASLVLNLLWLMSGAGIADLSVAQEPTAAIRAVHCRLRLDLSDSDANKYIRSRIANGFKAVLPSVMETVHRIAVSLNN
jgi:hypothetical protein